MVQLLPLEPGNSLIRHGPSLRFSARQSHQAVAREALKGSPPCERLPGTKQVCRQDANNSRQEKLFLKRYRGADAIKMQRLRSYRLSLNVRRAVARLLVFFFRQWRRDRNDPQQQFCSPRTHVVIHTARR
jgi:hypothetical protein